ncbi:HAD hydrolase, family IA [Lachnospiraceae bacterium MD335]|jgi:HAD superfamily hydrolase (TIGR01509 family)|nr:HAD hydrolase, family IA [Lachnospiraceae bacterium MD335]
MTFEAAIFDLDGTLLNSMHVWEQIDIEFLQKRGLPVPADYVVEICARSFEEAAQYTIELFGLPETIDDIIKEWNVMAAYEYAYNVKIQSYAMDYLLQLKSRGIKLAVATGLPKELFIPCLKNNSVLHLFDVLCSTDEVRHGKECPDVFELAAKRLRVVPERCIVFDDVLPAIKSAKMANMIACGIYDKYSAHNQTEIEEIADSYIFNFKEAPFPCKEV